MRSTVHYHSCFVCACVRMRACWCALPCTQVPKCLCMFTAMQAWSKPPVRVHSMSPSSVCLNVHHKLCAAASHAPALQHCMFQNLRPLWRTHTHTHTHTHSGKTCVTSAVHTRVLVLGGKSSAFAAWRSTCPLSPVCSQSSTLPVALTVPHSASDRDTASVCVCVCLHFGSPRLFEHQPLLQSF